MGGGSERRKGDKLKKIIDLSLLWSQPWSQLLPMLGYGYSIKPAVIIFNISLAY